MPAKQKNRKRIQTAVRIILALLLVLNVVILIAQVRSGTDFLKNSPAALLQVSGGSMEPKYHSGDAILVRPGRFESVKTGEVIVFCRDGELITHEVIAAGGGQLVTQGTANCEPDAPVSAEEYRATVICRIPGLGAVWRMYTSLPRLLAWTALLVLLIFGTEWFPAIYDRLQQRKNSRKA